jgi:hypothetical protein
MFALSVTVAGAVEAEVRNKHGAQSPFHEVLSLEGVCGRLSKRSAQRAQRDVWGLITLVPQFGQHAI